MNPETADNRHLNTVKRYEVGRISLGAQSFQPRVLAALGREHVPEHVRGAVELLRDAGFDNLSLDLMFGAPQQTLEELEADLDQLLALDVPHVSAYCLTYEPGTPLTGALRRGRVSRLAVDDELAQYRRVRDRLAQHGLSQYEISNYARPGHASRHNQTYWRADPYYGVGLGAGSYVGGVRRSNTRSLRAYLGEWPEPHRPPHEAEVLDPPARARERVILALRTVAGLDLDQLRADTGFRLDDLYPRSRLEHWIELGLLIHEPPTLRASARGLELADSLFVELV